MRKLCFVFVLMLSLTLSAQNKIDYAGNTVVDSLGLTYNVIVEFNDKDGDFGDYKVDVVSRIGNMAVVNVTAAQMKEIASLPQVKAVSLGTKQEPQIASGSVPAAVSIDCVTDTTVTAGMAADKPRKRGFKEFWNRIFIKLGLCK